MGFSSLHVCMESSDHWLQGSIHEESGMDSSSPSGDMLTCSRPLIDQRRLIRSPHDPAQKCPRCDSTHTKFCYYNNYSLSQPRYFCKTCRRYWTKGGTLRNIPVGGGCRKNKKVSAKKSNDQPQAGPSYHHNPKDIQLSSFPDHMPFSHPNNLLGTNIGALGNPDFMESKYNIGMVENPRPIEFMEGKFEGIIGSSSRNFDVMGNSDMGMVINGPNGYGICSPAFGGIDGNNSGTYTMDSCQRLMLPYDANVVQNAAIHDVKPNPKLLSLEWQDQGCSDAGKESFGYINGLGSWTGMMNGYGSSTTNPLV